MTAPKHTPKELWLPPSVRDRCQRYGHLSVQDVRYVRGDIFDELLELLKQFSRIGFGPMPPEVMDHARAAIAKAEGDPGYRKAAP